MAYRLFDDQGRLVDKRSLGYVHGYAQILPGLEAGLEGARSGERRRLTLEPEDAFGEHDPEGVLEVDRDELPGAVRPGDEVTAESPDGTVVVWRVLEVRPEVIVVDVNHPLAGQKVRFEVEIREVRPATDAEIERARRELGERIVDATAIRYSSEPAGEQGAGLVPLRTKPRREVDS
ncbi:MAG TPA: peptidylprolyl isomerase [Polyangiaceae bacterium]|nr:peptidylprolyl isomerase [Polyangiaceae bacterium]